MPRLMFVCDGQRDQLALPILTGRLLDQPIRHDEHEHMTWKGADTSIRLHAAERKADGYSLSGFGRKVLYALRACRLRGCRGLVAVLDRDKPEHHERLKQAKLGQQADSAQHAPLPAVIGEASPHFDAWLMDDPVAVRTALGLPKNAQVPDVGASGNPKRDLDVLRSNSARASDRPSLVAGAIAQQLDLRRCNHRKATGLEAFASDLRREIEPLFRG